MLKVTKGCVKVSVNTLHTGNHTHKRKYFYNISFITYTETRGSTVNTHKQSQNDKIT